MGVKQCFIKYLQDIEVFKGYFGWDYEKLQHRKKHESGFYSLWMNHLIAFLLCGCICENAVVVVLGDAADFVLTMAQFFFFKSDPLYTVLRYHNMPTFVLIENTITYMLYDHDELKLISYKNNIHFIIFIKK